MPRTVHAAAIAALCAFAATLTTTAHAGTLTPPPGAPASTNKTLQEVEPRTPLANTIGTITINQPGSYYLTDNLVSLDGIGINIQTSGVTLDLNGHTLNGFATGNPAHHGIWVSGVSTGLPVVIKNGNIRAFDGDGINIPNGNAAVVIENVHVVDCNNGFKINCPVIMEKCIARDNAGTGIRFNGDAKSTVTKCIANRNGEHGIFGNNGTIRDSAAVLNAQAGFKLLRDVILIGCFAEQNASGFEAGDRAAFDSCVAGFNATDGFFAESLVVFTNCLASSNGGRGFRTNVASVVSNCTSRLNDSDGFFVGNSSVITACTSFNNGREGFRIGFDCRVTDCNADNNGRLVADGAGFRGSGGTTIDSCNATDNDIGFVGGTGGLVIRCTAAGNTTNYNMAGTDHGAIISPAGSFTSTNAFANISY